METEEEVYRYTPAGNGAGPMWCAGSTCLVRMAGATFVAGLETVPDARPLNNCRWVLHRRDPSGWKPFRVDNGRTREPSPLGRLPGGLVVVSANPTLGEGPEPGGGAARPELHLFEAGAGPAAGPAQVVLPAWDGSPTFREHSYRSLAIDGRSGDLILLQNVGYGHAEWAYRNPGGNWAARGQLRWPEGVTLDGPGPVRLCYPNVAIRGREVHFFGVGDIVEPREEWREAKRRLTGRAWDYVFRRLFHTWTPDITREPFRPWLEIASREDTAGHLWPCDLHLADDGRVYLLWTDQVTDDRLRDRFFPDTMQAHALRLAVLTRGRETRRETLVETSPSRPGSRVSRARFQPTPSGRLCLVLHGSPEHGPAGAGPGNYVGELVDGRLGDLVRVPLRHPMGDFFTATPRAGNLPTDHLEMLGPPSGRPGTIGYARVRLFGKPER